MHRKMVGMDRVAPGIDTALGGAYDLVLERIKLSAAGLTNWVPRSSDAQVLWLAWTLKDPHIKQCDGGEQTGFSATKSIFARGRDKDTDEMYTSDVGNLASQDGGQQEWRRKDDMSSEWMARNTLVEHQMAWSHTVRLA